MVTQHKNIHIRPGIEPTIFKDTLQVVLVEINTELNKLARAFYSWEFEDDDIPAVDNLFRIIERTWVGIFNNALNRSSTNITTLQEFSVWGEQKGVRRCDLLIRFNPNNTAHDFITEAKIWEFSSNWKRPTPKAFYHSIMKQAYGYYEAEKNYYQSYQSNTWLMAFVVEWIRNSNMLEKAIKIMDGWDHNTDEETDFITLFTGKESGAFIYGKIMSTEEFERDSV